jgi:hypothetical protein
VDMRFQKRFPLGGNRTIDGMLELYNLANHKNYGSYTTARPTTPPSGSLSTTTTSPMRRARRNSASASPSDSREGGSERTRPRITRGAVVRAFAVRG